MSQVIAFEKLKNTRDLGGMSGADGRKIRPGKLIRSGQLSFATPADTVKLGGLICLIVDFRNANEHEERPDPVLEGVPNVSLPILDRGGAGVARDRESEQEAMRDLFGDPVKAQGAMTRIYEDFASKPFCRGQYERFVRLLLEDREKAVLWHCAGGKDRAGFASVIVQEILGVDREAVRADYMKTNDCLKEETAFMIEDTCRRTGHRDEAAVEAMKHFFGAEMGYLDAVYRKIGELYGDFGTYVREDLHITDEETQRLRRLYLE